MVECTKRFFRQRQMQTQTQLCTRYDTAYVELDKPSHERQRQIVERRQIVVGQLQLNQRRRSAPIATQRRS
jgi:hypothetical protein